MFSLARTTMGPLATAVITMSSDEKPATLARESLHGFLDMLSDAARLAESGEVGALVLTGTGRTFCAGADLGVVATVDDWDEGRSLGELGHRVIAAIADFPVPTVAYLNGTALGGGLEIALACTARAAHPGVRALGLPETYLGLIPGWGGCFFLPHLIGPGPAAEVIVANPLRNNTLLAAPEAQALGIVDSLCSWEDLGEFLAELPRSRAPESSDLGDDAWSAALGEASTRAERALAGGRPAPARAVALLRDARSGSRAEAFAREDTALADLMLTPELKAGLYASQLLRRAAPRRDVPSPIARVGVIGGGLMATQLALLLATRAGAAVTMSEVDEERAARTRTLLSEGVADLPPAAREAASRIAVGTAPEIHADADLVIEAVFEEMDVKKTVLSAVERVVGTETVLATNTSALSITEMGTALARPERLVGVHFFNPVAQMPLVEIVHTDLSDSRALDAARALVQAAGKITVDVADAPGFIVNRILVRLLGEILDELERGTPVEVVSTALDPMGLPMGPLQLLQLVGPAVARHVLLTLRAALGDRYPDSPGLERIVADGASFLAGPPKASTPPDPGIARYFAPADPAPSDAPEVLSRVQRALADEIGTMLADGVADARSIDLAMLTGAGWPLHRGGITPYLTRLGLLG